MYIETVLFRPKALMTSGYPSYRFTNRRLWNSTGTPFTEIVCYPLNTPMSEEYDL